MHVVVSLQIKTMPVITSMYNLAHHGSFTANIPLILNGDVSKPYRSIELRATLLAGRISVNPESIVVQPVPLGVSLTVQFTVYVEYFTRYICL